MKLRSLFHLLLLIIPLFGCRYEPTTKNTKETEAIDPVFFELTKELKDVYYRFPSPMEMFVYVDSICISFNPTVLHPVSQIDNYLTSADQALNMGVYIADLAYITLFQRYKESLDYLQTVYLLSEKLRISSAFEKSLIDRIDNNIQNVDSLESISEDAFSSIVNYLSKNNKENIFAIISVGSLVEFMNISLTLTGDYSPENVTIQRILDQKLVFDNIVKFSMEYKDDKNISKVLELIAPLTEIYAKLPEEKEKTTVTKTSDGQLVFGGKKQYHLTPEKYNEFKKVVSEIRLKITKAEI